MKNMQAKIIRDFGSKGNWILVGFHAGKDISRKEGLEIKNKYGMRAGNSYGHNFGYEGEVPLEVFEGGTMSLPNSEGKLKHGIVFDKDLYLESLEVLV